jgi:hypothetical protein
VGASAAGMSLALAWLARHADAKLLVLEERPALPAGDGERPDATLREAVACLDARAGQAGRLTAALARGTHTFLRRAARAAIHAGAELRLGEVPHTQSLSVLCVVMLLLLLLLRLLWLQCPTSFCGDA